ncbi:MAG: tetraacyldisaccharide 4'-kinase, partial [Rhodospirillales bacterium]|nr:tetraacyldisaccharide 4'-kinase [Rhodospirillales bacterium]
LAVAGGASVLVMDDGLQNASLVKDVSLLVIDGAVGFGNGRVLPAGPLREPVAVAAARCRAAVLIGGTRGEAALPAGFPVLHAHLEAAPEGRALAGQRVLAFAGIGRPEKFFATLAATGAILTALRPFPDHHPYSDAEQQALLREAASLGALPVTTPKDWVRLAPAVRPAIRPIGVSLVWHEPDAIAALLAELAP